MIAAAALVAELIHASARVGAIPPSEQRQLLQQAAETIRDLRERIAWQDGDPPEGGKRDIADELMFLAGLDKRPHQLATLGLLEAAETIRDLVSLLDEAGFLDERRA